MKQHNDTHIPTRTLLWRISLRLLLIAGVVLFCALLLRPLLDLCMPFVVAYAVTALLLAPVLRRVDNRLGRRKFLSVLLISGLLLGLVALLGGVIYYLVTQAIGLVENWESMRASLLDAKDGLVQLVARYSDFSVEQVNTSFDKGLGILFEWLKNTFLDIEDVRGYLETVKNTAPAVGNFLLGFIFFVVAAYFTTAEYPRIRAKLSHGIPNSIRPQLRCVKKAMGSASFGYLRAQVIISALVALIAFVALLIYGQPFALIVALAVGVVDFFPFFGSSVVLVPWAIVAFLQGDWVLVAFLLGLTFVLFMFRKLTEPKIVGDQTGLHPLLSLMSMYIGMKLAGVWGMIFMPVLWMAVISLYRTGFFDPTLFDIRLLTRRIVAHARLPKESE